MTSHPHHAIPLGAADRLRSDPRLAEAKRLLREVLEDHTAHIDSVRGPDPDRQESYSELLDRL
ncbi:MAG: hypothetical protein ACOVNV_06520, partial [Pirellulaceae bacterium]